VKLGMRDQIARRRRTSSAEAHPGRGDQNVSSVALNWLSGSQTVWGGGASGPRLRPVRGQAQMPEDAIQDAHVLDQREQPQPAATARAVSTSIPNVRRISSAYK
jgi:hypothetical protein